MLKATQRGWKPPTEISEELYYKLKDTKRHSALRGFVGLVGSWGGDFFQNYRLDRGKKQGYVREGYNSLLKLAPSIKNVNFIESCSYDNFNPKNMLIYADPPYVNNKLQSNIFKSFDSVAFWDKMREWSKDNIVIISEWNAPKDFIKIWSVKSYISTGHGRKTKYYQDNLYVHKDLYKQISSETKNRLKTSLY